MKSKFLTLLSLVAILSMAIAPAVSAKTSPAPVPAAAKQFSAVLDTVYDESSLKNAIQTPDGRYSVIVQLSEPALSQYTGGILSLNATSPKATGQVKLDPNSADSQAYIRHLQDSQAQFVAQLSSAAPSAQVSFTYQVALNGLALTADKAELARIAMLNGVQKIYPNQIRQVQMDSSLPLIKAAALWAKLGGQTNAGAGIKVADVDTGLDVNNPMFDGTGFTAPAGYPKGYCATNPSPPAGPTRFVCNDKVIVGRFFYDPNLVGGTTVLNPAEVMSPFGVDSHGSHTAGTITGRPVTVDVSGNNLDISGVAPAAYLMVYKALFSVLRSGVETGSGTDAMLIAALNAAVADGADVINNSWGGGAGGDPNSTVYKPLIASIQAAGTLVVFSAGNDGPGAGTIGCPGCVEDALTVAASTTSRTFKSTLQEISVSDGTIPVPPAVLNINGRSLASVAIEAPIVDLRVEGVADTIACAAAPLPSFTGKIVVIERGVCALVDKVAKAQAAGAVGVVLRNVAGGATTLPLIDPVLPTVHINSADGDALFTFLTAVKTAGATATYKINTATIDSNGDQADVVASFSSVGPDGDPNVLKPDITAPGVNILSASSPILFPGAAEPKFEFLQGTSMAAPHITGSAALIMQQHPTWTPQQVKTALTTSAVQTLTKPDGVSAANPFDMGSGRVDLQRAGNVGATFSKTSFANSNCIAVCSWTATITNTTAVSATWNAAASSNNSLLKLSVSPASVTLPAGASTTFMVSADVSSIVPSNWFFGSVVWKDAAALSTDAYFPLAVRAGRTTSLGIVSHTVDKPLANNGDALTYTIKLSNPLATQTTYTVGGTLSDSLDYVLGSETGGLAYDPGTRKISGSAAINGFVLNVAPTGSPTHYAAGNPTDPLTLNLDTLCLSDTTCDEVVFSVSGFNFDYMGSHVTTVKISSNGFIAPGTTPISSSATNQQLPSTAAPNNVIAPLWSDLEFSAANAHWMVWGTPTETFIEWQNVSGYGSATVKHSFEIRIVDGTSQISFAYGALSPDVAAPSGAYGYTVGAENIDGTAGKSYYYYGGAGSPAGTAPAVGTDLNVVNSLSSATMTFQAKAVLKNPFYPLITNMVTVVNNNDASVQTAAAYTTIKTYPAYMPVIGK